MSTCGQCRWAGLISSDLKMRICRGIPPQIVATPQGVAVMFPNVAADQEQCGQFTPKDPPVFVRPKPRPEVQWTPLSADVAGPQPDQINRGEAE